MRNIEAEKNFINKVFMIAGALFILGLLALAVGTEILILSFWDEQAKFWIWQGVWALCQGFILATIGKTAFKHGA
jgi:hypothetical protein